MSKTVTVACRLPAGLELEVGRVGDKNHQVVQVKGLHTKGAIIENGYALTLVPEEVWVEFVKKHEDADYLVNRMIFAEETLDKVKAGTRSPESAGKTKFEALDPERPPVDVEVDRERLVKNQREAKALAAGGVPA